MNKKLGLAVAGALVAFSSAANAGITIPAGDWTVDIGGVVNAYYTSTTTSGARTVSNITTGLLPNYLAVSGKTRQNDLDVAFTISINPGASTTSAGDQGSNQENRQAFLTIGDASWGSVKLGKDLGIYASDAILNDMTLLGVGNGAGALAGNTTTLGRIGGGFIYADWKSQIAYTSPNWNGFQFTAGVTQSWNTQGTAGTDAITTLRGDSQPAFEGKVSYAFTADTVTGKVWASAISQNVQLTSTTDDQASAWDLGANVNVAGFGLTGYYGEGSGLGTVVQFNQGYTAAGVARDSKDWYVQGTYTVPTLGTKLGVSYGESTLDGAGADVYSEKSREQWTVGAYHPLTKSVNLVAEYTKFETTTDAALAANRANSRANTVSLGAILFF
jgi:predicted porin